MKQYTAEVQINLLFILFTWYHLEYPWISGYDDNFWYTHGFVLFQALRNIRTTVFEKSSGERMNVHMWQQGIGSECGINEFTIKGILTWVYIFTGDVQIPRAVIICRFTFITHITSLIYVI